MILFLKGYLSQWATSSFTELGITYNCAEQYMMYQKAVLFADYDSAKKILATKSPKEQKRLGREVKNFNEKFWNEHKVKIVLRGNLLKFSQNLDLKANLLNTGDELLAEANPYDKTWGIGLTATNKDAFYPHKWKGQNLLGKTLMKVREELRDENIDS